MFYDFELKVISADCTTCLLVLVDGKPGYNNNGDELFLIIMAEKSISVLLGFYIIIQ